MTRQQHGENESVNTDNEQRARTLPTSIREQFQLIDVSRMHQQWALNKSFS